ncbi:MAG: hypothetical protein P857_73 [Candidatus Xenolissoclinum pacificiensis L6]|uniref:Uncharacterized protein n=1 Tax=Candidatus Xenolissoclinum pacificiensis L6 TaxID=1401685 RepID=W2V1G0_9RICK|nr:MAG: hypothetical protein P857_73 [Candidatus Xenolissoclinum pacificiensis L6]
MALSRSNLICSAVFSIQIDISVLCIPVSFSIVLIPQFSKYNLITFNLSDPLYFIPASPSI